MKLSISLFVFGATASHFRGGTYKVQQTTNNRLQITNTQTWRLGRDLYRGGCDQSDITNRVPSDAYPTGQCTQSTCPNQSLKYTALFIGSDYCYGDGVNTMDKPRSAFNFGWSTCCWVNLTKDTGATYGGGNMVMKMQVNDLDNNSPTFKLPPLWVIMAGCPDQLIDLAPTDMDGDTVKCRWATRAESGGAYTDRNSYPSLTLDEENCVVHYDGTKDQSAVGVKPITLMMEDFDKRNQIRSSIPVQFLAQVWTPNLNTRSIGDANWPQWFPKHHHEEDSKHREDFTSIRGRRSLPSYCTAIPTFGGATPPDGAVIDARSGRCSFTLQAFSVHGVITGFDYQGPSGCTCTTVNNEGEVTCSWRLTTEQLRIETHQFCWDATDSLGLKSERQCITIRGVGPSRITNITQMAEAVLDGSGEFGFTARDGTNYGCSGRGYFDYFSNTVGAQVDLVDKAFYKWKKCTYCARVSDKIDYIYDQIDDSCAESTDETRGLCECDRELVNFLYNAMALNTNFDSRRCFPGGHADTECCQWDRFHFAVYNVDKQCCSRDGVREIGTC